MSAVWAAARAAVRRRRLQTFVIGLVALFCTATVVVSLALLDAMSAPFDRAFAQQRGAHAVAAYDPASVTDAQLTAARDGVAAAAGPFAQATVEAAGTAGPMFQGPLTLVGRADPGGEVDRLDLWRGRWASAPGEIVLAAVPEDEATFAMGPLGDVATITVDGSALTVVGWAYSVSATADGWVTPEQAVALKPSATQMLYRFAGDVPTREAVQQRLTGVTTGLPGGALLAAQPYQVVKEEAAETAGIYLPFLGTFGILGLLVAVIIVGNVVSGAVISGFRHIGVLKSIGFTPRQVVAVYLTMVTVPASAGAVLGTALGVLGANPLLNETFQGMGYGRDTGVQPWVWTAGLLGVPALVLLAALLPASRAHRLSAAAAISAGSAPRRGRGLRVQRALSGTRLPRPVSLGLGLPFARPGRTVLTLASLLLGVTTVTFTAGLAASLSEVSRIGAEAGGDVGVRPERLDRLGGERTTSARTDQEVEALLRGTPGAVRVGASRGRTVPALGQSEPVHVNFIRGDTAAMGYQKQLLRGRWLAGADEVVASAELLNKRGLTVGDTLTLEIAGARTTVTIVGETVQSLPGPGAGLFAAWRDLGEGDPFEFYYQVELAGGADIEGYMAALRAADPGLTVWDNSETTDVAVVVTGFSTVLAVLLAAVAALGVLNTVALNVQDRRRDLGMLKSVGMTPRQVIAMLITSMAALGVIGGLVGIPIGMAAHRVVVPLAADAAKITMPGYVFQVWEPATLLLMLLSGVLIAIVGALLPARSAARLSIARALHNE
ncbi:ABC transporter permease [Actinoplanes sp. NPDC023801]|uniref:ABC transporter permease n=1 Tax=Actinoplanes sp. NPDC023801 TaxID=3154595 RepID=UPI0033C5C91F